MRISKKWLLLLAVIMAFSPLLVLYAISFTHPSPMDDYVNSVWDKYLDRVSYLYTHSSGRYFHNLVLPLCPMHWLSISGYRLTIAGIFGLFSISLVLFVFSFFKNYSDLNIIKVLSVSVFTLVLYINNVVSITEAFFWFTGAVAYIIPALLLLHLFRIFFIVNKSLSISWQKHTLSILLVIVIIGGNEIAMMLCDTVCGVLLIYYFVKRDPVRLRYFSLMFFVCLLSSCTSVLASGNIARHDAYTLGSFAWIPGWLQFGCRTGIDWITNPYFLIYSIVLLILFKASAFTVPRINLAAAFLLPFALIFYLSLPVFFGLEMAPPPRVQNIIFLFFIFCWIYFLLNLSAFLKEYLGTLKHSSTDIKQLLYIAMAICLMVSINSRDLRAANFFRLAKNAYTGAFKRYNNEMQQRYALIKLSLLDTVVLPPLSPDKNNILLLDDLLYDPKDSRSMTFGAVFGKKSICLRK